MDEQKQDYTCARCEALTHDDNWPEECPRCAHDRFYYDFHTLAGVHMHRCAECCLCESCEEADTPCHGDCGWGDDACEGCELAMEEQAELQWEIDRAQGKY